MDKRKVPVKHVLSAALALSLLTACGSEPSSSAPATASSEGSGAPADAAVARPASEADGNSARFTVDAVVHEFSSPEGGMYRNSVFDAPEIDVVTFEAYTEANDLYVKVDINVPKGGDPDGEYAAGILAEPNHRTATGQGQVTLAVETDPAVGRSMYPSGSGRITVTREGDGYRAEFEVGGDGQFRAADAPAITGFVRVQGAASD